MALSFTSLNSGSNGNCYYLANKDDAILIDAGISCRETEKRMLNLGLPMSKLRAVFVSHEHIDHIRGIPQLAKKYRLPVYITKPTLSHSRLNLDADLIRSFRAHEVVRIGELAITAFPKFHDASDPHSFTIEHKGFRVGVFTDIGSPCEEVLRHFRECHSAFLEANYDEDLLERGRYPYHLKARIRGGKGHLSNRQALDLFCKNGMHMNHLLLSHLSGDNNNPETVMKMFSEVTSGTKIIVASRDRESELYHIGEYTQAVKQPEYIQYNLF